MNRQEILYSCKNVEDKRLVSKVLDKVKQCERQEYISLTDFLDQYQKKLVENNLVFMKIPHVFYGGYEEANRTNCLLYPKKFEKRQVIEKYGQYVEAIRIVLPKSLQGKYQHRHYLGSIIKLGIKREKTGDILCDDAGADMIVQKEVTKYLMENLPHLTRFAKATFEVIPIEEIRKIEKKKKEITIVTSSLRIDNIIAELLGISRTKANEFLAQKRVLINYQNEIKNSKLVKEQDVIVIRGKGKYEFSKIEGNTKKNKFILAFLKYV